MVLGDRKAVRAVAHPGMRGTVAGRARAGSRRGADGVRPKAAAGERGPYGSAASKDATGQQGQAGRAGARKLVRTWASVTEWTRNRAIACGMAGRLPPGHAETLRRIGGEAGLAIRSKTKPRFGRAGRRRTWDAGPAQLTFRVGRNGSGATGRPSSISLRASSGRASPWIRRPGATPSWMRRTSLAN